MADTEHPIPRDGKTKGLPVRTRKNAKGQWICGGWTRDGRYCTQTNLQPNGRCKLHGGKNPAGVQHHNFRHGRFSEAAAAALADPELLELRNLIAAARAYRDDFLERCVGPRLTQAQRAELMRIDEHIAKLIGMENKRRLDLATAYTEAQALFVNMEHFKISEALATSELPVPERLRLMADLYAALKARVAIPVGLNAAPA